MPARSASTASRSRMESPRDAIAHGIGMVHQHFMLVDTFTVLENLVLGAEGGPLLAGGLAAARAELARLAREYGLTVDPDALIADLSVGEQQRVEILKVLFRGARILILDEPSAVLTPQETDQLFRILATLKERGVTVVLITHKLREIMAATDHVYVMRQGQIVAERRTAETNPEELAELMVGRKVRLRARQGAAAAGRGAAAGRASRRWSTSAACGCSTISGSSCAPARSSASPASRATARPSCCRCCRASARRPAAGSRCAAG